MTLRDINTKESLKQISVKQLEKGGDERRRRMERQVVAKFARVSKTDRRKRTSDAPIIETHCGEENDTQRDKRGFGRGLSDRHLVHIQSSKMTPKLPSRGTSTPVTSGYTLTLSLAVGL